jgi:hypothetical protein
MVTRYYFDIRNGEDLYPDKQGLELPDRETAAQEAMQSLLSMANSTPASGKKPIVTIEVRTDDGPVFLARLDA